MTTPTPQRQTIANRIANVNNIMNSNNTNNNNNNNTSNNNNVSGISNRSRFLEGLNLETPISLKTSNLSDKFNSIGIDKQKADELGKFFYEGAQ